MFCVVYELKVSPEREERFRQAWHDVTKAIVNDYGSLGARLHKDEDGLLIAYAQWPDRESWQAGHHFIEAETKRLHLEDCLDEIPTVVMKLMVLDDLLVCQPDEVGAK